MQNPKPRLIPTHFIEVWSNGFYNSQSLFTYEIGELKSHLFKTRHYYPELKTVALFLIKPKKEAK